MRASPAAVLVVLVAAAGCSGGGGSTATETPTPTGTGTVSASPTVTPTPSPTSDAQALLPHSCGTFISITAVERAVGRSVADASYLREKPLPSGRLGRVTCTWATHVAGSKVHVPTEVSATVNVYLDHPAVAERMRLTLAADKANGNVITDVSVGGHDGSLDRAAERTTLLLPLDRRVLVLQVDHATVAAQRAPAALQQLATIALRTLPSVAASPSAAASRPRRQRPSARHLVRWSCLRPERDRGHRARELRDRIGAAVERPVQQPLLRREPSPPNVDAHGWCRHDVAVPVGRLAEAGHHRPLRHRRVGADHLQHGTTQVPRAPPAVGHQQEAVAQEPTEARPEEPDRRAEQPPHPPARTSRRVVAGRHAVRHPQPLLPTRPVRKRSQPPPARGVP